jgi:GTP-binding protein LepA
MNPEDSVMISAKYGKGVEDVLEAIVKRIPPPKGDPEGPLKALLFDSWFDIYRGVLVLVRVIDGELHKGMKIRLMSNGQIYQVDSVGVLTPKMKEVDRIEAGEVGYLVANIKGGCRHENRNTITEHDNPTTAPSRFQEIKPMVFAGLYPVAESVRRTARRLENFGSTIRLFYEPETSTALVSVFDAAFLGLLTWKSFRSALNANFNFRSSLRLKRAISHHARTNGDVKEMTIQRSSRSAVH